MTTVLVLDLEVENHPYFGAPASPRHPDNYVVAVGWARDDAGPYSGEVQHLYFGSKEQSQMWCPDLTGVDILVCHNTAFELDWLWEQHYEELRDFINAGGRVYCTQLGHYRLSGQQDLYPSLDEIAPLYGGTHKVDAVKILWEQGHLTSEIDPELLIEYLAGPEGDVENTRRVFYGQVDQLVERGAWNTVLAQCDGKLFNSVCMSNGMQVDREFAYAQLDRLTDQVDEIESAVRETLRGWPDQVREAFSLGSLHHKSAWVFGGYMRVNGEVPALNADGSPKWVKANAVQDSETGDYHAVPDEFDEETVDTYLVESHYSGEPVRYLRGKKAGLVKLFRVDTDTPLYKKGHVEFHAPGLVDLSQYPRIFRDEFMKEFTGKLKQADETPVLSTSEDAVDRLINHPNTPEETRNILKQLNRRAALDKTIGTFFQKDNGRRVTGMLQYLTEDDRVHHSLNTESTNTGRLSGTRPNMQNVSTDEDMAVKRMFPSRFGDSGCVVNADYKALEVVALADLSGDEALQRALVEGVDLHSLRACPNIGMSYEEFEAIRADRDHPRHAEIKRVRDDNKPKVFAYQYGASAYGIAYTAGCTVEEAQAFIEAEKQRFPGVEDFMDRVAEDIAAHTETYREQNDDGRWRTYQVGTWTCPGGLQFKFRQYPTVSFTPRGRVETMEFKPTQMRNYPTQGLASLFVQVATGWLIRWLFKNDFFGGKVRPINTVHDSVVLDVHHDVLAEVAPKVKAILEHIPKGMRSCGYDLKMQYPVDLTAGPNYQDQEPIGIYLEQINE